MMLGAFMGGQGVTPPPFEWSPYELLGGRGVEGAYFDFTDISTLFRDLAGTTPVTASGQEVNYAEDLSGNGHPAICKIGDPPEYREDNGFGSVFTLTDSVFRSLSFDQTVSGSQDRTVYVALRSTASGQNNAFVSITDRYDAFTNGTTYYLNHEGNWALRIVGSQLWSNPDPAASVDKVFGVQWGTSLGASSVATIARRDGSVLASTGGSSATINTSSDGGLTGSMLGGVYRYDDRGQGSFQHKFSGYIYALFVGRSLYTPAEIDLLESWMASRCSVVL